LNTITIEKFHSELMSIENYNYAKSSCPNYGDGKWNENEWICEISDPEKMAAYEDHICDETNAKTEFPIICG
jgi:hypothetical protein